MKGVTFAFASLVSICRVVLVYLALGLVSKEKDEKKLFAQAERDCGSGHA
jgi:hypothetical protein